MEVCVLCSAREHTLPPTFSEAQCLCCNPSSVCLLQVWMEIVHLFLRLHLSLTVSPSDLFHHEVSATVRSLTFSLGRDQERHEAWYSRMCVSWPWSLDFREPCLQSSQTYTIYTSTEVLSLWHRVLLLHWFFPGESGKVPDSVDERLKSVQTKSLNNWHFIYMADIEWSSILIDSCLFAKGYDVENVPLKKKENLLIGL